MANDDLLTEWLDLPNTRVTHDQRVGQDGLNRCVESTVEAAVCPDCQQVRVRVHAVSEPQMLGDLSMWKRRCGLR